jgi:PAS domain S-box-containing protein
MIQLPKSIWLGLALIVGAIGSLLWLDTWELASDLPQLRRNRAWVDHTFEVLSATHRLDRAVTDAERNERNFRFDGRPEDLQAYREAAAQVPAFLTRVEQLTSDNPAQTVRLSDLRREIGVLLEQLREMTEARQSAGFEAARAIAQANARLSTSQRIDGLIDDVIGSEDTLLGARLARSAETERRAEGNVRVSSALALLIAGLGTALLFQSLARSRRSEAQRRDTENRLSMLINAVADHAIYMLDPEGRVANWNAGAQRITGYAAAEIVAQHFSRFYTDEDRASGTPERTLETAARTGKYESEAWRVRKDGTRFWASVVIEAVRDPSGALAGFAKITRDMTERRQQQLALEQARAALAQAQKMEALGQLSGGIAHDYNNLVHVIRNAVDMLQRRLRGAGEEELRLIDMIKRNADRAATLTQRLLAFSRRQPLEAKPVDVNRLVAGMAELVRHALGESISMETVLSGRIWQVLIDPNQLESAILNLVVNARDAMPEGGRLTIETANTFLDESYAAAHAELKPGQYVMIAVSDTGVGMSADIAAKAFDPFFTTKDIGKGTGLGLSQVYGFMKQSGGHVQLYSEPGDGTTVKLYLPRSTATLVSELSELPAAQARSRHGTILVVEDEDDVRAFTCEVLRELGYGVLAAPDGATALALLQQDPQVALLFTDVGLPGGMNGRELAERACRLRPDLKVIYTTGYARNAIVHHGRLDPGVELIAKPFTQAGLAGKISRVLSEPAVES